MIIKLNFKPYLKTLFLFLIFCLGFLFVRNSFVQNNQYNFLVWNLFLGFIPFLLAFFTDYFSSKLNRPVIVISALLWLLFYPNAPYMVTDFIHVQPGSDIVVYDALLIFSFAMLSLFFGFYSLKLIEKVLLTYYKRMIVKLIVIFALILSSFGIYLGRILRLNSWDLFTNFIDTMLAVFNHLFPVTKNPVTYMMIFLFTVIQWLLFNLMLNIDNE